MRTEAVTRGHWPVSRMFQVWLQQSLVSKNCHEDMISLLSYHGDRISHLHPCCDTNKCIRLGSWIWCWQTCSRSDTGSHWHISCKSYKEQCVTMLTGLLSLKQGTQAVIFNQWRVSFPSNQPIRVWLYMTHSQLGTLEDLSAEDDTLSLSLTTWILWIDYSQPGPTLINSKHLLSLCDQ